jgi:protein TonB
MAAGTLPGSIAFDAVTVQAWRRLFKACAASLLLHLILIVAIPVRAPGDVAQGVPALTARLEPVVASDTTAAATATPTVAANANPTPGTQSAAKSAPPREQQSPSPAGSGIEAPFAADPTYYPARQLDVYPRPVMQIALAYPESAANAKVDGRLLVLLLVDESGVVNDASVVEAEPAGYFEEAALAVLRHVQFAPAQKAGRTVKSRVLLQLKYSYGERAGTVR